MTNDLTDYFDEATPSQDESSIGRRIVQARQAAGLTTAQLARRLGIRGATLSNWESDKSQPRANRMTMLAGVLNVSPTWLPHRLRRGTERHPGRQRTRRRPLEPARTQGPARHHGRTRRTLGGTARKQGTLSRELISFPWSGQGKPLLLCQ